LLDTLNSFLDDSGLRDIMHIWLIRYVHPNVPLVSDGAAQGWCVLVLSWSASRRKLSRSGFRIFGDGLNILEILEVSL
jgi:hypothetical protein